MDFNSIDYAPPIIFNFWDGNNGAFGEDVYLGRTIIDIKDCNANDGVNKEKEYKLTLD